MNQLPPEPRLLIESNVAAAAPFVGIAKKLAKRAYLSGIRAKTWQVAVGTTIRVENYPESYLSKVYIKTVSGFLFESGLYNVPPDSKLYDNNEELTHHIYYGDLLEDHFTNSGQWQGRSSCNKDKPFTDSSPYYSKRQTRYTAQVADRFQPAMYTGLARLMMQGKLASGRNPDEDIVLPLGVSQLKQRSIFVPGFFGEVAGCVVDPDGNYWIVLVNDDIGLIIARLETKKKCTPTEDETDVEEVLRISHELSTARTEGPWISLLSPDEIKEHTVKLVYNPATDAYEDWKIDFGHDWHWRRQTEENISKASMVVVEKDVDAVDFYVGRIITIELTWSEGLPTASIFEEDVGEPIRPWIIGHPLTFPFHETLEGVTGYQTWCIDPPLDVNSAFEPYEDNITPVYCFYDQDGELVVVEYVQRYVEEGPSSFYLDWSCFKMDGVSASAGYRVFKGGYKIRGAGQPIDPINPQAGLDNTLDFSLDKFMYRGSVVEYRGTKSVTNSGGLLKFADSPLTGNNWFILAGTMYAPNLFNYLPDNGFPTTYKWFEHWGQPSDKTFYVKEHSNPTNLVTRSSCIIPYSDAEAVTLLGETHATYATYIEKEATVTSSSDFYYLNGGEVRLFYANPDGSKGGLAEARPFSTLFSKAHTGPYTCCVSTSNWGNPCFSSSQSDWPVITNVTNDVVAEELRGVVLTSTYQKSFDYNLGDWYEFFEILDCDEILVMPIFGDVVSAFQAGGQFTVKSLTAEIDTDDNYESVPFMKAKFIGGA